jgi:hypothetical protein
MLPFRWKLFRLICIFQVVLTGLNAGYSFLFVFSGGSIFPVLNVLGFTSMALFASLGVSLIHRNYPDELPDRRQKRYFNILYIFNFLLVSFAGAHVFMRTWAVYFLIRLDFETMPVFFLLMFIMYFLILLFQIYILYGMFRLRRELYANYMALVESITSKNETAGP